MNGDIMLIFVIVLSILLYMEYRIYKTCISPFFVIGIIYLVSVSTVRYVAPALGYYRLENKTIYLFLIYLSIIFFSDIFFKTVSKKNNREVFYTSEAIVIKQQKIIWYIFCVMLIGYTLSLLQSIEIYGIYNIKGKSGGIYGHMGLFAIAISPYIIYLLVKTKKIKYLISIGILYTIMILFGGKTYLFVSLLASSLFLYAEHTVKFKKMLKLGIIVGFIGVIFFLLIYAVVPCYQSQLLSLNALKSQIQEALEHMFYYFSAPFLCSNSYFDMPAYEGMSEGMKIMFSPVVSIYEAILGDRQYPYIIMTNWIQIGDLAHRTTSNVGGLFSESVFHIGYIGSFAYLFIICLYENVLYYIKRQCSYFHASSAMAISILALCFFCNYFTLLVIIEMIVYLLIFETLLFYMSQNKKYIRDWRFVK